MGLFEHVMNSMNAVLWGPLMIALLVGTGIYLTVRHRFVQIRYFAHSIKSVSGVFDNPAETGDISHFQALAAALSATIGTGNIAGVATAIAMGGPGAVFWMWVTALVGMATKFTCCSLAVKFRVVHPNGSVSGGPMYYLAQGLGLRWLGVVFALFAGMASFGIGCMVQSNSVADGLLVLLPSTVTLSRIPDNVPLLGGGATINFIIGFVMAFLVGIVIIGGIKRIANVASRIVPFMCAMYMLGALIVLVRFAPEIPGAFAQIFTFAFTPMAAGGGFVGYVLQQSVRMGVARGVFSNEAGLGSAPMAHAAAKTKEPIREGFVAMLGPFIDTIVICSVTALAILVTGVWQVRDASGELLYGPGASGIPVSRQVDGITISVVGNALSGGEPYTKADGTFYPIPTGSALTAEAFGQGFGEGLQGLGQAVVALGIILFAYSTMISWSYYGDRCWEFLLGPKAILPYRVVFCVCVVIGSVGGLRLIWLIADNLNALMAIPNLIALLGLSTLSVREGRDYIRRMKAEGRM